MAKTEILALAGELMMNTDKDIIRKQVSEFYTASVNKGCGCSCGCTPTLQKGVAVKTAGYNADEISALPEDAVVNSFGCGNPLAFSNVKEGQTVLDLGSGAGIDLLIAARKVGPSGRVIGVDMTDDMISRARSNIAAAGYENIEVRKGIIENLPVEDASVDWVISNCVINLSPEKNKVFSEIARVLKPGGQISISDIVVDDLPEWVRESAVLYGACVAGAISEKEYIGGLIAAGLQSVEVTDRFVYGGDQLEALIESEIPQETSSCCCSSEKIAAEVSKTLKGKIWSARFSGKK